MADTISASQGPRNPRLSPELLNKQQVAASGCTVTTDFVPPPLEGNVRKVVRN